MIGPYETSKLLGAGAFGVVKLAKKRTGDQRYAIKSICKQNILRSHMGDQVRKEISILKSLDHPNIVQIFEVLMSADYLHIVMDYIPGGELYAKITKSGKLSDLQARRYVRQLCGALRYCHNLNVCHRDIKPQNILLDEDDNALLADFGFASIMEVEELKARGVEGSGDPSDATSMGGESIPGGRSMEAVSKVMKDMSTLCGTTGYMPPEIVNRERYMGDKADVWSLGVVIYVLLVGFMPFRESDDEKVNYRVPDYIHPDARDFLSKMLTVIPEDRYSARRLLLHPWVINEADSVRAKVITEEESADEHEGDDLSTNFTSLISKDRDDEFIVNSIKECMEKSGWKVLRTGGALRASSMTTSGMVMVSVELNDRRVDVKNARISKEINAKTMGDLNGLINECVGE